MICRKCKKNISPDEVGLTKKLINRGIEEFLCYDCLAEYFHVTAETLRGMADHFRAAGCTLFPPKETEDANPR